MNIIEEALVAAIDKRDRRRRNFRGLVSAERKIQERRLEYLGMGYVEDLPRKGSFYEPVKGMRE